MCARVERNVFWLHLVIHLGVPKWKAKVHFQTFQLPQRFGVFSGEALFTEEYTAINAFFLLVTLINIQLGMGLCLAKNFRFLIMFFQCEKVPIVAHQNISITIN